MPDEEMNVDTARGPRWGLWIPIAVAAVLLLAVAIMFASGVGIARDKNAASANQPATFTSPSPAVQLVAVAGGVRLTMGGKHEAGTACAQGLKTKDVHEGSQVTITDAAGSVLATPVLGPGKVVDAVGGMTSDCRFVFSAQVAAGAGPYGFEVGQGHGVVHYDEAFLHKAEIEIR